MVFITVTLQRTESGCFDKVPFFPMESAVTVQSLLNLRSFHSVESNLCWSLTRRGAISPVFVNEESLMFSLLNVSLLREDGIRALNTNEVISA